MIIVKTSAVQWTFLQIYFTLAFRWRLMKDTKADPCVYQWKQRNIEIYCLLGICKTNMVNIHISWTTVKVLKTSKKHRWWPTKLIQICAVEGTYQGNATFYTQFKSEVGQKMSWAITFSKALQVSSISCHVCPAESHSVAFESWMGKEFCKKSCVGGTTQPTTTKDKRHKKNKPI